MSGAGRPLRFLAMVIGGWTVMRVAFLLPEAGSLPAALREMLPLPRAASAAAVAARPVVAAARLSAAHAPERAAAIAPSAAVASPDPVRVQLALLGLIGFMTASAPAGTATSPEQSDPGPYVLPPRALDRRLTGSAWLVAREGRSALSDAGQLGGSQAGARLRYALDARGTLAATARLSSPLAGKGAEAALGIEWRPTRLPVAVIAEQRVGLDGTRGGPALFAVGGLAPTPLGAGIEVEGYAQAGGVARGGPVEPFADGSLRATRRLATTRTGTLSLGAGAWGGAQRDAARFDVGPSAVIGVPIAGRSLRLSADWRHRIAGDARPGSGLAVTLGADF